MICLNKLVGKLSILGTKWSLYLGITLNLKSYNLRKLYLLVYIPEYKQV